HHDDAVRGEQPVIGIGVDDVRSGREKLQAHQRRGRCANEEEGGDRYRVQDGDALVIPAAQPRPKRIAVMQIAGRPCRSGTIRIHGGGVGMRAHGRSPASSSRSSDRMYSMMAEMSSSFSWVLNEGMMAA